MSDKLIWWGYLHINKTIQVKRFFGVKDIQDAHESPFVAKIFGPFEAQSRDEAIHHIEKEINHDDL